MSKPPFFGLLLLDATELCGDTEMMVCCSFGPFSFSLGFIFFLLADEIAVSILELLNDLHNSFWLMFFWQLEVKIHLVVCTSACWH